ncbi:MAG: LysR family transcriptional regulator [Motiliproteus sp.]
MDLLKAMHSFRTVVEQQSFSGASRQLNIATSAISRQVTELEQHLGCKLLQRTTRSMTLTAEGRDYLAGFDDILDRVKQLEQQMSEKQRQISGHLRITSPNHSRAIGLQPLISRFLQRYPQVKLSWLIVNRYINMVEEGIDLAIRVGELPDSSLIARQIDQISIHFVASPAYLAQHGQPKHPKQLINHRCLLDSSNRQPGRWRYRDGNGAHQASLGSSLEVSDAELVADFAVDGLGIAYLPGFIVAERLASGELVRLLTDYEMAAVPVSLVYPQNRIMTPTQRALIDFLVENKRDLD